MPAFIPDKTAHFWSRVEKTKSGCWLWTGAKFKQGYGCFWDGIKRVKTHRFSYQCAVGSIPRGMFVLHRCDVRACVNPDHLFLGTHLDNYNDMVSKGRDVVLWGESHGNSKLSSEDVRYIRRAWRTRRSPTLVTELQKRFNLKSRSTIYHILTGKSWSPTKAK